MRTPTQYAEDIKMKYACALSQLANPDETIEVPSVGDRPPRRLARQTLAEIVEPRYEELFGLIRDELRRSGFEEHDRSRHRAHRRQRQDGRRRRARRRGLPHAGAPGLPQHVTGLVEVVSNPIHATGVGLLLYARANAHSSATRQAGAGWHEERLVDRMKSVVPGQFLKECNEEALEVRI